MSQIEIHSSFNDISFASCTYISFTSWLIYLPCSTAVFMKPDITRRRKIIHNVYSLVQCDDVLFKFPWAVSLIIASSKSTLIVLGETLYLMKINSDINFNNTNTVKQCLNMST